MTEALAIFVVLAPLAILAIDAWIKAHDQARKDGAVK